MKGYGLQNGSPAAVLACKQCRSAVPVVRGSGLLAAPVLVRIN